MKELSEAQLKAIASSTAKSFAMIRWARAGKEGREAIGAAMTRGRKAAAKRRREKKRKAAEKD